jgi:DNA-binding HxlR family transcriptional regulator
VLPHTYDGQECSIARALEVLGERWTLLLIRDVFLGIRRYEDLHRGTGIARNILQARLLRLCDEGIFERRPYAPGRYEYYLTKKGWDLFPVMMALNSWGDRYYAEDGAPRIFKHRGCKGRIDGVRCRKCGAEVSAKDVYSTWGRGAGSRTRRTRDPLEQPAPVAA